MALILLILKYEPLMAMYSWKCEKKNFIEAAENIRFFNSELLEGVTLTRPHCNE